MGEKKPAPIIGPDNALFWEGCKGRILVFQRCARCGHVRWPPAIICPRCLSHEVEECRASGRGRIYTYVVYHLAYHEAFREDLPYVVALVDLEEGPRLLSNIVDCDIADLACEIPVECIWDNEGEIPLPKFRPVKRLGS